MKVGLIAGEGDFPLEVAQSISQKNIEVFIVAGGIYLFMTFIIHNIIKFLEKKYSFN